MIQEVPIEIFAIAGSGVTLFAGLVWKDQSKRINDLERHTKTCPFPNIQTHIAKMATDIDWIKKELQNKKS